VTLVPPDVRFSSCNAPNSISAGTLPQTPLGSLQRSPDCQAVFKGAYFQRKKGGGKGKGKGRGRKGRGNNDLTHPLSQIPGYVTVDVVEKGATFGGSPYIIRYMG